VDSADADRAMRKWTGESVQSVPGVKISAQIELDVLEGRDEAIDAALLVAGQRGCGMKRRRAGDLRVMACDGLVDVFTRDGTYAGIRGRRERPDMFADKDANCSEGGELQNAA
jgi:hypothetical protein